MLYLWHHPWRYTSTQHYFNTHNPYRCILKQFYHRLNIAFLSLCSWRSFLFQWNACCYDVMKFPMPIIMCSEHPRRGDLTSGQVQETSKPLFHRRNLDVSIPSDILYIFCQWFWEVGMNLWMKRCLIFRISVVSMVDGIICEASRRTTFLCYNGDSSFIPRQLPPLMPTLYNWW